eukprot:915184-Pyramimonas_sp.AAC.1
MARSPLRPPARRLARIPDAVYYTPNVYLAHGRRGIQRAASAPGSALERVAKQSRNSLETVSKQS